MFNFGGIGNLAAIMGSVQQMPAKIQQLTEQLKSESIFATAGGGAVQVTLNGVGQMQSIQIDPAARDNPQLEQWIVEACNAAGSEAKKRVVEAVSAMAKEMKINIPGLDGMLAKLIAGA
jgi:nucleoid-associated protein EbfC